MEGENRTHEPDESGSTGACEPVSPSVAMETSAMERHASRTGTAGVAAAMSGRIKSGTDCGRGVESAAGHTIPEGPFFLL